MAVGPDDPDRASDRGVAHRDRLRRPPCEPRERYLPDPAFGGGIHRVRRPGAHRDCPLFGERELERSGRLGVSRVPAQHPSGRTPHAVPPPLGREALSETIRNRGPIVHYAKTCSTLSREQGGNRMAKDAKKREPTVNLRAKLDRIGDYWKPKIIAELNDSYVKLVKLKGEFVWHHHRSEERRVGKECR